MPPVNIHGLSSDWSMCDTDFLWCYLLQQGQSTILKESHSRQVRLLQFVSQVQHECIFYVLCNISRLDENWSILKK